MTRLARGVKCGRASRGRSRLALAQQAREAEHAKAARRAAEQLTTGEGVVGSEIHVRGHSDA